MLSTVPLRLNSKYILILASLYIACSIASDTVAFKFVNLQSLAVSGATIIWPLTYVLSDIIAEVYGYNIAKKIIWLGLFCELLFGILVKVVLDLPAASFWNYQAEFNTTLGSTIKFITSGIMADIVSSFLNIYVLAKLKILTKGKHFWIRSMIATALSEITIVFLTIVPAFWDNIDFSALVNVLWSSYILELIYLFVFVTPSALIASYLKMAEGYNAFDTHTRFNPFIINA